MALASWAIVNQKYNNLKANGWKFVKQVNEPYHADLFQRDNQQCYFLWSSGNIIEDKSNELH